MVTPAKKGTTFSFGKWFVATLPMALLLIFCPPGAAHANDTEVEGRICLSGVSVDVVHVAQNASGFFAKSGYFFPREAARLVAGVWHGCVCDFDPCLPLCPPKGKTTNGRGYLVDDYVNHSLIPPVHTDDFDLENDRPGNEERLPVILRSPPCPNGRVDFLRKKIDIRGSRILGNGSIILLSDNKSEVLSFGFKDYCLQQRDNDSFYSPKICIPFKNYLIETCVTSLVAMPFVIATLIVYSVLQELRNTYGTMLRCYLCCLIVTYVTASVEEMLLYEEKKIQLCTEGATYFWTIAGYLWLNVMSFDIWWRFSDFGSLRRSGAASDRKRFIGCSIYAWGVTLILTAIYFYFGYNPGIVDVHVLWIVLFRVPVGVIMICNICLFILTVKKMVQHDKETRGQLNNANSQRHDENKYWFCLHVKLCVVMGLMVGISWSTWTMYWSNVWHYFYLGPRIVNALQGVLIFVIFVCKKNIWLSLKKRFNNENRRVFVRHPPSSSCISQTTSDSPATAVPGEQRNPSSNC